MAKEGKKETVEITVGNIEEVIKSGATVTEEMAKEAAEKIAKQRKEELTERLISGMQKSDYTRKRIYLAMKKTDKEKDIRTNYLKKFSEIDDDLKNGKISIDEWEKKVQEEKNTATKLLRELDNDIDEQRKALDNQYRDARWSWNYGNFII